MALMTEVLKGSSFKWTRKAHSPFKEVKTKLAEALVLHYLILIRYLRLNASSMAIGGVLI